MILTIDRLMMQIHTFQPICVNDKNMAFSVASISFFSKSTDYSELNFLYLGYASQFVPDLTSFELPVLIICIEDITLSEELLSLNNACIIRLPKSTDLFSVCNAINSLFHEDTLLKNYTEKLYEAMLQNQSIQDICNMTAVFLKNPVVVMDRSLKHIAISTDIELEDYVWLDQKKNGGYISDVSLDLLKKQMANEKNFNDSESIILPKGVSKYRRIIHHITFNNQLAGTIIIFEVHKEFHDLDIQFIKMLSDLIALKMKSDASIANSKAAIYEHFFLDLLEDKINSNNLYERLQTLKIVLHDNIYMITIDIREYDQTHRTIQYFKNTLDEIINEGTSVIYNNNIVMIIMLEGSHTLSEAVINKINVFCKKKNLFAGISKCFHDISKLKMYYEQTVTALYLNRRFKKMDHLVFYEDFITEHMMDIASNYTDLKLLCNEDLITLDNYDRMNHTSYTSCLYEFLIHERSLTHTAEALHIHRNTLIYRLNRIKEILNHDLEDSDYRFSLLLSFKIIAFLETITALK